MLPTFKRLHFLDFAALFICGVVAGTLSGGVMNALNGWLSPDYFALLFYYPSGSPSWSPQELYWHSIRQGLLEGVSFGVVMTAAFTAYAFTVSKAACRFAVAAPYLPKMVAVALVFYFVGGLNGVLAALLFPNMLGYILALGGTQADRLKFIWVGGSIYGVYFGSLVSLYLGCAWFRRRWHTKE